MENWFDKSDKEILSYLKKEYGTPDLSFIGQYFNHNGTIRFVNVRTLDYFSLNFLGNEELNTNLKGKKLWVHIHKEISEIREGMFYQFKAKLSSKPIREKHQNPFALQIDETYFPIEYNPIPKEFVERRFAIAENTHLANNQQLAKALNSIQREINKSPETFIFELLQNASDYPDRARDNKVFVSFKISDNYLLFCHSGAEFKVNNVHSICSVNESDKADAIDKIGFKGIGFKSVFKDCNFAYIKSGGYSFRFDSSKFVTEKPYQIIPIWTEPTEMENEIVETTIFKNSTVSIALKPRRKEKLQEYHTILNKLFTDDRILLFLPNIENAKIITPTGFKESKKNILDYWIGKEQVTIPDNIREWINKEIDDNESVVPEKYYDIQNSVIQFATSRISNQIAITSNSVLYNYLPTRVNLGFDFLINGDFIPDGTREFFHNIRWNDFLIEQSGFLFLKWIKSIGEKKDERNSSKYKFKRDYLKILPDFSTIETQIIDERNKHLLSSFKQGFDLALIGNEESQPIAFIPTESNNLVALSNILIDETGLADLLKVNFYELTGIEKKLIHKEVGDAKEKIKTLITQYDQGIIYSIDELKANLKEAKFQEWLKLPANNFKLLKYFFNSDNVELKALLDSEKIVLSETGELLKVADLFNTIPDEVSFIVNNKVELTLKGLLDKEKIELKLMPFNASEFYKANLKTLNLCLTNENNILNVWSFIYDNWLVFKDDDEIKKSLYQLLILCKPIQEGVLNIKIVSSAYVPKEFAKEDEVETIIATLNLKGRYFIESKFSSANRPDIKKWNEVLKLSRAKSGLKDVITELVTQLPTLDDSLHFKACIEIFRYWKANKEKPETQLTEIQKVAIQQALKLKCGEKYYVANQCIISEYYSEDKRVNKIMPSIILKNQISSEYQPNQTFVSEWKQFFSFIECKDLNSEQVIFNYKVDYLIVNQDIVQANHFIIMKDFDLLIQANQKSEVPITFDFVNKFAKIKLQTSVQTVWAIPNEIHFSTDYTPVLELQSDNEIQNQFKFLSPLYLSNTISKDFLIKLGVHNNFCFINITPTTFSFYPSLLLTNKKYTSNFWKFIIDSEIHLKQFSSSNILSTIKTNNTIKVSENVFKKPTELFSKSLETYVDDKSLIPLIDLSKYFTNDNRTVTLEQLIGINQELSINQCLALLKKSNELTQNEVSSLKIVNIIQRNQITVESIVGIKLPNTTYSWLSNSEIYFSQDAEIISQHPNNLLHPDFNIVFSKVGVTKISVSDYKTTYAPTENSNAENEIKTKFNSRAEYVAFVIANGETRYSTVAEQLKTFIGKQNYIECDDLYDTVKHDSLIWKRDRKFLDANPKIYFTDELASKKSEIRKYLFKYVLQQGKVTEKIFHRYIFDETEIEIIQELNKTYDIPEKWLNKIQENENQFRKEVEQFIESLLEVEDIYDEEKVQELKSILADFKNQPDEKRKTFNLLAKLKLCKRIGLSYDSNWEFNKVDNGNEKYFIHSARGSFAYIHPNELLQMRDEGFKMAIDFGTNDIRIYNSPSEIIELYKNYLMLYQGNPSEDDVLSICEDNQDKAKFHFLIVDREKQTNDALAILKILNNDSYE
jgi:hypothetical protein